MILTSISASSPAVREASDSELVAAVRDGSDAALEALFARYARLVYRIAADILRDRAEAEDMTQDIFLEIYRKAHLYDAARGSVRVWLLQYAYRRTFRRRVSLARRAAYHGEPLEHLPDPTPKPPRLTLEECRWILQSGLAQLPEKQRTTLELTCFEDLTLRDVAGRLGVSVGCTRHYYYRGLARLQRWARITGAAARTRSHGASRDGKAGGATAQARPRLGRV